MVLRNLLDGGSSHSRPLFGPSESVQGDTPGTNPRQIPALKCLMSGARGFMWLCPVVSGLDVATS
jgi:hypothetical protein